MICTSRLNQNVSRGHMRIQVPSHDPPLLSLWAPCTDTRQPFSLLAAFAGPDTRISSDSGISARSQLTVNLFGVPAASDSERSPLLYLRTSYSSCLRSVRRIWRYRESCAVSRPRNAHHEHQLYGVAAVHFSSFVKKGGHVIRGGSRVCKSSCSRAAFVNSAYVVLLSRPAMSAKVLMLCSHCVTMREK